MGIGHMLGLPPTTVRIVKTSEKLMNFVQNVTPCSSLQITRVEKVTLYTLSCPAKQYRPYILVTTFW